MICAKCGEPIYYTGEHNPTLTPQRFYSCINRHVILIYGQEDKDVDWGDGSITKAWREAVKTPGAIDEYEMIGKEYWK